MLPEAKAQWVGILDLNCTLYVMNGGGILNFMLTKANVDDRDEDLFNRLTDNVFGKLFADKGYISKGLFEKLFNDGINLVTGIRSVSIQNSPSFVDTALLLPLHKKDVCTE